MEVRAGSPPALLAGNRKNFFELRRPLMASPGTPYRRGATEHTFFIGSMPAGKTVPPQLSKALLLILC